MEQETFSNLTIVIIEKSLVQTNITTENVLQEFHKKT